jgi:hypothetical protein
MTSSVLTGYDYVRSLSFIWYASYKSILICRFASWESLHVHAFQPFGFYWKLLYQSPFKIFDPCFRHGTEDDEEEGPSGKCRFQDWQHRLTSTFEAFPQCKACKASRNSQTLRYGTLSKCPRHPKTALSPMVSNNQFLQVPGSSIPLLRHFTICYNHIVDRMVLSPFRWLAGTWHCRKPFNVFVIYFLSQDIAYHYSPSIKAFKTLSHHRKPVAAKMRRHILTVTLGWHWLRRCDSIDGFSIRGPIALSGSPRGLPLLKLSQSLLTTTKMTPGQRLCNIMQL